MWLGRSRGVTKAPHPSVFHSHFIPSSSSSSAADTLVVCAQVIAANNRVELLDPALLRFSASTRHMTVSPDVNYDELARSTDDFNGAMLKAVCVEAGMLALRRGGTELLHQDFVEGISQVQAKKKSSLNYYV
ncbi:putative 26S protease regulatory subunit 6A A [Paratrimastix pyriformis]|uniref:26S protease regulatory subunit 6A A n=1 Tax=Paratrimastix pyriformis TaxID=342808 RepID=A0ABQ8U421_9EUKA|nr:putative 26S protease regulatory subunit 6A A [Paratrimastix pyriformis]